MKLQNCNWWENSVVTAESPFFFFLATHLQWIEKDTTLSNWQRPIRCLNWLHSRKQPSWCSRCAVQASAEWAVKLETLLLKDHNWIPWCLSLLWKRGKGSRNLWTLLLGNMPIHHLHEIKPRKDFLFLIKERTINHLSIKRNNHLKFNNAKSEPTNAVIMPSNRIEATSCVVSCSPSFQSFPWCKILSCLIVCV